jgi:hypothetical protein
VVGASKEGTKSDWLLLTNSSPSDVWHFFAKKLFIFLARTFVKYFVLKFSLG